MAKKAQSKKAAPQKGAAFFKNIRTQLVFRNEKGKFISKAEANKLNIEPKIVINKSYFLNGKPIKKTSVPENAKIIERYKTAGKFKEIESQKIKGGKILKKDIPTAYGQEYWQSLKSNIQKELKSKIVAIKSNGVIQKISEADALNVGDFLTELDYLILGFFSTLGIFSLALFVNSASTRKAVIYDLDEIEFGENVNDVIDEGENNNDVKKFNRELKKLKRKYFK
jgi:hypothetical protein